MEDKKDTNVAKEDNAKSNTTIADKELEALYLEMAKSGVMYGHRRYRRDPHFEKYVFAIRNGIEIIDLEQTVKKISEVAKLLKEAKESGKNILLVGTQVSAKDSIKKLADVLGSPYVVNKWIGGLITNFNVIRGRIDFYLDQVKKDESGEFEKYTKNERLKIKREIEKMKERFEGLENYNNVPDVVFIIDSSLKGHRTAIDEAKKKGNIIILGIIDNDDNPRDFDEFIPANDHSQASISWIVDKIISEIK